MNNITLEISCSIIGIFIGALASYIFFRKKYKAMFSATLCAEYKNISQELAEILKDILQLSLIPQKFTKEKCNEIDRSLSDFTFKYLLILPQPLLEEINCLHVCLISGGHHSYIVKNENGTPVLQPRESDEDIKSLLNGVAIVTTKRTLFDIYKKHKKLPPSVLLKCQARRVMTVMSECWNLSQIYKWGDQLTKKTIAKRGE